MDSLFRNNPQVEWFLQNLMNMLMAAAFYTLMGFLKLAQDSTTILSTIYGWCDMFIFQPLNLGILDFLALCAVAVFVYEGLKIAYKMYTRAFSLYARAYLNLLGTEKGPFKQGAHHEFVNNALKLIPDFKGEAAFSSQFTYNLENSGTGLPLGVFLVYGTYEGLEKPLHLGHGFVADGKLVTAVHLLGEGEYDAFYVGVGNKQKLLPVKLKPESIDPKSDYIEFDGPNIPAIFGIKTLKFATYNRNVPLTVIHYDNEKMSYTQQMVRADIYDQANPGPGARYLLTETNTCEGDSGLPVLQRGKVVALHSGADLRRKRNVHCIPLNILSEEYERKAELYGSVLKDVVVETSAGSYSSEGSDERARALAEERRLEKEAAKEARMRGEHQDEQGFRMKQLPKISKHDKITGVKGNWYDSEIQLDGKRKKLDDAFEKQIREHKENLKLILPEVPLDGNVPLPPFIDINPALTPAENKAENLKAQQPATGASEVPLQSPTKLGGDMSLHTQLDALSKEVLNLKSLLTSTATSKTSSTDVIPSTETSSKNSKRRKKKTSKSSDASVTPPVVATSSAIV